MVDPQNKYDDEGSSYGVPLSIAAGVGAAGTAARYGRKGMAEAKYNKNQTLKKRKAKLAEYEAEQAKAQKAYDDIKKAEPNKAHPAEAKRLQTANMQVTKTKARVKELDPNTNFADTKTKTPKTGSPTWKEAVAKSNLEVDGLEANATEATAKLNAIADRGNKASPEEVDAIRKEYKTARADLDRVEVKLKTATKTRTKNQAGLDKHGDVPTDGKIQTAANDTVRAKDQTQYDKRQAKAKAKADKKAAKDKATDTYTKKKFNREGKRVDLTRPKAKFPKGSAKYLGTAAAGSVLANTFLANQSDNLREYAGEEENMGPSVLAGTGANVLDGMSYMPGAGTAATAAGLGAGYVANQGNRMYNIDPDGRYFDATGEITPDKTGFGGALKQGAGDIRQAAYDNTVGKVKLAEAFRKKISPAFMGGDRGKKYDDVKKELDNNAKKRWTDKNTEFYKAHNAEMDAKTGRGQVDFTGRQHYINGVIQNQLDGINKVRGSAQTNLDNAELDLTASKTRLSQQTDRAGRKATNAKIKEIKAEIKRNNTVLKDLKTPEADLLRDRKLLSTSLDTDLMNADNVLTNTYVEGPDAPGSIKQKFRTMEMGKATVSGAVNDFMTGVTDKLGQAATATGAAATAAADKGKEVIDEVVKNPTTQSFLQRSRDAIKEKTGFSKNVVPDGTPVPDAPDKPGRLRRIGGKLGVLEALNPGNIFNAVEMGDEFLNAEDKYDYAAEKGGELKDAGMDLLDKGVDRYNQYDEAWDSPNSDALLKEMAWNDLGDLGEGIVDYGKDFLQTGVKGAYNIGRGLWDRAAVAMGGEASDMPYVNMDAKGWGVVDVNDPGSYSESYDQGISDDEKERLEDEADLEREVALANSMPVPRTAPNRQNTEGGQGSAGGPAKPKVDPMDKYNSSGIGNYDKTPVYQADPMSDANQSQYGSAVFGDTRSGATPEYFDDRNQPDQVKRQAQLQVVEDAKYDYLPPALRSRGAQFEKLSMKDQYDIIDKYNTNTRNNAKAKQDAAQQQYSNIADYSKTSSGLEGEVQSRYDSGMASAGNPVAISNRDKNIVGQAESNAWYHPIVPDFIVDPTPSTQRQSEMINEGVTMGSDGTMKYQTGVDSNKKPEYDEYDVPPGIALDLLTNKKY